MKILLVGMTVKPEAVAAFREAGGTAAVVVEDEASAIAAMTGADAVVVSDNAYTPALAAAIQGAPALRWMQIVTAGYDNVTRLGAPTKAVVTSVGDAFSPSVAVHAVALMLALQRGVHRMAEQKALRVWDRSLPSIMVMPEGRTVAILGFGSIGREIARIVAPLGMKVIGLNRSGAPHPLATEVHGIEALSRVLPHADALIVAAPLNPSTLGIVGEHELALMKPTAVLINISRGKLVDTMALDAALRQGRIAGAGLDVTEPEPLPADHPLWDAPNLIISPHVAGAAGAYGTERQIARVGANIRRFLAGEPVQHFVRP
jgi:phosphoglycerate dehydrogenase-like enzyme